jgi:hypothetical protein
VTVWEALTGALPFTAATLARVRAGESGLTAPSTSRRVMPARIERILRRGLSEHERYPSLDELLRELADDPLHRRLRRIGAVAVLVGVVIAFALGTRSHGREEPCLGAAAILDEAWSPDARVESLAGVAKIGGEYGPRVAERMHAALSQRVRDHRPDHPRHRAERAARDRARERAAARARRLSRSGRDGRAPRSTATGGSRRCRRTTP